MANQRLLWLVKYDDTSNVVDIENIYTDEEGWFNSRLWGTGRDNNKFHSPKVPPGHKLFSMNADGVIKWWSNYEGTWLLVNDHYQIPDAIRMHLLVGA